MKLLRIRANGLPLYKKPFDISFYTVQQVQDNHLNSVFHLFGSIYVNAVEAFTGINAAGKTTALRVLSFANLLLGAVPLSADSVPRILDENIQAVFEIDFFADGKIFHLMSQMIKVTKEDGSTKVKILAEKLWSKPVTGKVNKTNFLDFNGLEPVRVRDRMDEYLPDDVSIMIALNKQIQDQTIFMDLSSFDDFNWLLSVGKVIPSEIVSLFDPSVEYITAERINGKVITRLKFCGKEELVLFHPAELNAYLSSGTVKGIRVFSDAVKVLKNRGYLMIDDVEKNFNRELAVSLLRLFMNKKTNPEGAVLIFSTHDPALLDELDRNDAVFIVRNDHGLIVDNLNSLLKRNDMKKSEIFQSNYLGGTAPKYSALSALGKLVSKSLDI